MTSALTIELSKHSFHISFSSLNDIESSKVKGSKILVLYIKIERTTVECIRLLYSSKKPDLDNNNTELVKYKFFYIRT